MEILFWIVHDPSRKGGPLPLPRVRDPSPHPATRLRVSLSRNGILLLKDDIACHIGYKSDDIDWSVVKWRRHTAHRSAYRLVGDSPKKWLETTDVWTKNVKDWKAITLSMTLPSSKSAEDSRVGLTLKGP
jgi:hypothetical protein